MGDLWPASVLVTDSGLRLFDWESAHYGFPSQDVGHLAAHLWMHAHRAASPLTASNARAVLQHFLETYRAATAAEFDAIVGIAGIRDSAIHFGSEILTRTVGAFQNDYLYSGLAPEHPLVQAAVQTAATHIRTPLGTTTFGPLGWRSSLPGSSVSKGQLDEDVSALAAEILQQEGVQILTKITRWWIWTVRRRTARAPSRNQRRGRSCGCLPRRGSSGIGCVLRWHRSARNSVLTEQKTAHWAAAVSRQRALEAVPTAWSPAAQV